MRCSFVVALFTGAVATAACNSEIAPRPAAIIIGNDTTLLVDEVHSLTAFRENGTTVPNGLISWSSSAPNVASIDSSGRVTALTVGLTSISATTSDRNARIDVIVKPQFVQIATGELHSCGISGRNQIYCWGTSAYGELGSTSSLVPCGEVGWLCSAVPVLATSTTAIGITAGSMFTCALGESGEAYCWGANFYGQLGGGSGVTAPTSVPQLVTGGHQFTQLVAGRFHVCGITTSQDAYCWGWDDAGQLGAGDVSSERCTFFSLDPCSTTPRLVAGGHKWGLLAAAERATCGIALTGVAYCWGFQVGGSDGLYCEEAEFLEGCMHTPIQVGSDHLFRDISIGDVHRCEQAADNTLECWGGNFFGAFGDGTEGYSATPMPAAGGSAYSWLVSSKSGMCGLSNSGHAQCWGSNEFGQVGNGVMMSAQLTPDDVAGNYVFDALASAGSSEHVCGITRDGRALCWGRGQFGALGNGAMLNRSTPQFVRLVPPPPPSEALAATR